MKSRVLRAGTTFAFPVLLGSTALLALLASGSAVGAPGKHAVTYTACIELTGNPQTFRDLKLREGPCAKNERQIAWPPGARGPTGPTGAVGPPGSQGAQGAAGLRERRVLPVHPVNAARPVLRVQLDQLVCRARSG